MMFALGCRWNFDSMAASDGSDSTGSDSTGRDGTTQTVVQRDIANLPDGMASVNVPIQAVDTRHAILVFSVSAATFDPADGLVEGILNTASVTFSRAGSTRSATISWQVIETPLVNVQHGVVPMPGAGISLTTVPIAAVDLSRSFVIISLRNGGGGYDEDDYVKAKLTGATSLELQSGMPAGGGRLPQEVAYQIVTLPDGAVEQGDATLVPTSTMASATITSPTSRSVPWISWRLDADNGDVGSSQLLVLVTFGDLRVFRSQSALDVTATWYVASSPSFSVQADFETFAAAETSRVVPITAVDLARSFVVVTGAQTTYSGTDPMDFAGNGWFRAELAADTVTLTREDAQASAQVGWSVVSL